MLICKDYENRHLLSGTLDIYNKGLREKKKMLTAILGSSNNYATSINITQQRYDSCTKGSNLKPSLLVTFV